MSIESTKKAVPIGVSDFKVFYEKDYYYIDKTLFIKEVIDNKGYVNLFTRPRRFGKTLNLSMLKYFFERYDSENFDYSYLFKSLKIWKAGEQYRKYQGKYPVISLTLKDAKVNSWNSTYLRIISAIADEYKRHNYLLNQEIFDVPEEKLVFRNIMAEKATEKDFTSSIKNLCKYLELYYGQKPIILLDEYDVPLQNSYINNFYDDCINFMRALLQEALKDNQYLEFSIITGCLRISKESIFTGLNNLEVNSILDKQYGEYFGFLQSEVDELLEYYELREKEETIKSWYNGYQFGTKNIYNPWSVLKCIKDMSINPNALPASYWANTSGNDIVKRLIFKADEKTRAEIEALINGETIEKSLNANVTYGDLEESTNNVWSMLFFTGYLTYTSERREGRTSYYTLRIPNEELLYIYETIIHYWFKETVQQRDLTSLFKSLVTGDTEAAAREINSLLAKSISVYDHAENFYHGFLVGVLQYMGGYRVKSNRETGEGRSDIMLEPISLDDPAIIIELKRTTNRRELLKKCDEALNQIEEKNYAQSFLDEGYDNILKYGVAFFKKGCLIKEKSS